MCYLIEVMSPSSLITTQDINFITVDGVSIKGSFIPSAQLKSPLIIMLHQLGRTRKTYEPYWPLFKKAGFAQLALDIRGHGESIEANGKPLNWEDFEPADWQNAIEDVKGALSVMSKKRGVDLEKVGIVGASIGANLAFRSAALLPEIKSAVLLSPGLDYRGLTTEEFVDRAKLKPLMIVAAEGDKYSFESSESLSQKLGPGTLNAIEGEAHGTDMLAGNSPLVTQIIRHFQKTLI